MIPRGYMPGITGKKRKKKWVYFKKLGRTGASIMFFLKHAPNSRGENVASNMPSNYTKIFKAGLSERGKEQGLCKK
jgi:hypothetical protein